MSSSYNSSDSQPQLLTPQFFEQPPKLLPPSAFRQAITAGGKLEGHQNCDDSDTKVANCTSSTSTCVSAVANPKPNEERFALGDDPVSKKIKLSSESDPVQDSFNPRCDNRLLLVAENVSYSLAAKQRWKKSAIIAPKSSKGEVEKVLEREHVEYNAVTPYTPTKGQRLPLDTPIHLTESTETAVLRSSDSLTISSVNDPPAARSEVSFPSPAFIEGRDLSNYDKPLISAPRSPSYVSVTSFDNSYRNDFDKVHRGSATKPHTTDNLKLSYVESSSTELDISSWKVKSQSSLSSSSTSHCEFVSPTLPKDPCHFVDAEKSTCAAFVRSVETMASAAVGTESDHMLAQLLQNEEYGHASGVPGQYIVEQEVKRKVKKPPMDCSSDFEIARRLQQEVDAEVAHSMQRQVDHRPPGWEQRLGTGSDDDSVVHKSVGGFYDNNNQYCYKRVEHPDVHVSHDRRTRGSSSLTRRPMSSHHHYHSASTATAAAVLGEDLDMSYEALVQLEDVSRGLDKDTISRLSNTYKYHPSSSTDKSCSVCLCEFESGELLRSLPCIHAFHENCIDQWLTENRHCPVCMKDIDSMIT